MADCRYLVAADDYQTGVDLHRLYACGAPKMLCVWAHFHPTAVEKLADTPPWLMKTALAADLWREGQCEKCACRENGEPVEQPRTSSTAQ